MSSIVQATSSMAGAYSQSESIKAQGSYQQQVADSNAKLERLRAADAKDRGNLSALEQIRKTNILVGEQRAAQAAGGADITTGSAALVRSNTQMMGEMDALTIKNNAWREAWGYQTQANTIQNQGEFARIASNSEANNTLLTGGLKAVGYGLQAYDKWQSKDPVKTADRSGGFRNRIDPGAD